MMAKTRRPTASDVTSKAENCEDSRYTRVTRRMQGVIDNLQPGPS